VDRGARPALRVFAKGQARGPRVNRESTAFYFPFFFSRSPRPDMQVCHLLPGQGERRCGTKTVEKFLNYFLLLHLNYKNKNENSKVGYENERELTKYQELRKRINSSGFISNTVDIRKLNTKYRYVVPNA
jgi:hypothetical protein